jgi:hypothetical protein
MIEVFYFPLQVGEIFGKKTRLKEVGILAAMLSLFG